MKGKKTVALKVASVALTASLIATPIIKKTKEKNTKVISMPTNNIIVYNVGDHQNKNIPFEGTYIEKSNSEKDDIAIIITPSTKTISGICDDVEYAKSLIANYKIGPVYLNIEPIMSDNNLSISDKINLIETFLTKSENNGIYVGTYGTTTTLNYLNSYYDLKNYNTYLIDDGSDKEYNENVTFIQDTEGNLEIVNPDIFRVIEEKELNNSGNFTQDLCYIVNDINIINYIADVNNISVNELLEYNGFKSSGEVNIGSFIRVPNKAINDRSNIKDYATAKGIDISEFQNTAEWHKVKENVDFIIIRATYGQNTDTLFEEHYKNATQNDLSVGIYSYSYASSKEEMEEEAKYLVENLKGKNISYPVYLDLEDLNTCLKMSGEELKEAIEAWSKVVKDAGYVPGIYTNMSIYKEVYNKIESCSPGFLNNFSIWIAGGREYSTPLSFNEIEDPGSKAYYNDMTINCHIRQVSSACQDVGIQNSSGFVDLNYCYVESYNNYTVSKEFPIKSFSRINIDEVLFLSGITLGGIQIGYYGIKLIIAKRKYKKLTRKKEISSDKE